MRRKSVIIILSILLFFTVSVGAILYSYMQEVENQLHSHPAFKLEVKSGYQMVIPDPQESTAYSTASHPSADIQIPLFSLSDIQNMKAGTVLMDSMLDPDRISDCFYSMEITEEIKQRIMNASEQENDSPSYSDLRYLRVLHRDADNNTHIGELIVNMNIADDILAILYELYLSEYPIEKMVLMDEYQGDAHASIADNNTSAFYCSTILNMDTASVHSAGLAMDINPLYNPYFIEGSGSTMILPENGAPYTDRSSDFPYKIEETDICVQLFEEHGFIWGGRGSSPIAYSHFEKAIE